MTTTATAPAAVTRQRVLDLVAQVERGTIDEAMREFYAEEVVMQESNGAATHGRAANVERERAFFGSITVHEHRALSVLVDGDRSAINWLFDYTAADGTRYRMNQIAHQTWRDGRIVHERFYYDSASLVVNTAA